jgi:hypothetical protein
MMLRLFLSQLRDIRPMKMNPESDDFETRLNALLDEYLQKCPERSSEELRELFKERESFLELLLAVDLCSRRKTN